MGPLNGGWTIAKRLLQFERNGTDTRRAGQIAGDARPLDEVAKEYVGIDEKGRIADPDLRPRIAKHMMEFRTLKLMQQRMSTRQGQAGAERDHLDHEERRHAHRAGARRTAGRDHGRPGPRLGRRRLHAGRARHHARLPGGKATTIFGGTAEIQNNIISKRILGLLDHQ